MDSKLSILEDNGDNAVKQRSFVKRVAKGFSESSGFVRLGQLGVVLGIVLLLLGPLCLLFGFNKAGISFLAAGIAFLQIPVIAYARASFLATREVLRQVSKAVAVDHDDDLALVELALQGLEDTIHSYGEELKSRGGTPVAVSPVQSSSSERTVTELQNAYAVLSKSEAETLVISSARLISELKAAIDIPTNSLHRFVPYDDIELTQLNDIRRYEQILVWVDSNTEIQSVNQFVPYAWVSPDATVLAGPTTNLVEKFMSVTAIGTSVKPLPTRIPENGLLHVAFERSLEV